MPTNPQAPLVSLSYASLDDDAQKLINGLFEEETFKFSPQELFKKQRDIDTALSIHLKRMNNRDDTIFKYLDDNQKKALKSELLYTFYLLYARYSLNKHFVELETPPYEESVIKQQLRHCAKLIIQLNSSTTEELVEIDKQSEDKAARFLGLSIGQNLAHATTEFAFYRLATEGMSAANWFRLYWVWGGGLLSSILSLVPDDFYQTQQTKTALNAPANPLGYVSWILYYTRFAFNLTLLLRPTLQGAWMTKEEKETYPSAWERFKTQWDARKFQILNDTVWATVNLVTFFWLVGAGSMLGFWGNFLTTQLLVVDLALNAWGRAEEFTKLNQQDEKYQEDIKKLRDKLRALDDNSEEAARKTQMAFHLRALENDYEAFKIECTLKRSKLTTELVYGGCLVAAFAIVCASTLPASLLAPATAMILGVTGAGLCFILGVALTITKGSLEIIKSKNMVKHLEKTCHEYLEKFNETESDEEKKMYYLEMQQLLAQSDKLQRQIIFQKIGLIRSIFIESLVPAIVFAAFTFLPLNIGLGVLAAGFALAVITYLLIDKFAPKDVGELTFDEASFKDFKDKTDKTIEDLRPTKCKKHTFFSHESSAPQENNVESQEQNDGMPPNLNTSSEA